MRENTGKRIGYENFEINPSSACSVSVVDSVFQAFAWFFRFFRQSCELRDTEYSTVLTLNHFREKLFDKN